MKEYDYSQPGAYFVTICTKGRESVFGEIKDGEMQLNRQGQIVEECWRALPLHYPQLELDSFVVMPNHVHGIVVIHDDDFVGAGLRPAPTRHRCSLSEIVRAFKSFSARQINALENVTGRPVWQRNYFEHIIRSERSLNRIRQYISNNAMQWQCDRENPSRETKDEFEAWLRSEGRIGLQRADRIIHASGQG